MMNGMQILVNLPAFGIEMPGNAMIIVEFLKSVASFDFPYIHARDIFTNLPMGDDELNFDEE
jgi:hypothetical protein